MSSDNSFSRWSEALAPSVLKALQSRKFEAYYCNTGEEAAEKAISLIPDGSSVAYGGSVTVQEIDLIDRIRKGDYKLIDRDSAKTADERFEIMRRSLLSDVYITSVNALSEDGQLVNVDGIGNRVAAMTFGPKNVIVIVGMNKICRTVEDAVVRARTYAAPLNTQRISALGTPLQTPCVKTGSCADCKSDGCICSYIVTTRMSKVAGRIKIILVGQSLGY
ncbi:MAG: lactate utilization protein [Candidatus Methanoplasma sp.]|jgi:L-lactate utilization protein LutB|nr:lactate utilization protein [Candidatus Methanoplasma sp.]